MTTRKNVLFVDDDPNVLAGLRRMLRKQRNVWEMQFAPGGQEAVDAMCEKPYDVVVTDMRMPGIDGAELLRRTADVFPNTVRVVLSGQSEHERVLRAVGPAHQFLSKPCDPQQLVDTIERASDLQDRLSNATLRRLTSQLETIPSLPSAYEALVREVSSDDASLQRVADTIGSDIAMSAKVLQLVNSSFFGLPQHVSSPQHAVTLLGLDVIRPLLLTAHAFAQFDGVAVEGFSLESLIHHSLAVATTAKSIAESLAADEHVVNDAFMAGLLHDIGKLVLAANLPKQFEECLSLAQDEGVQCWQAEQQVFGATHAAVGGYLLGLWGLPTPLVEAVTLHHCPSASRLRDFQPLAAVHLADCLHAEGGGQQHSLEECPHLDSDYLQSLNPELTVSIWEEIRSTSATEPQELEL